MSFRGYKLKFKLHAAHSNMAGDLNNIHYHTFTLALYLKNINEETDFFFGPEKEIEEWLAPYQNTELPHTELFFGKSTSLESIGDVFFDEWKEKVAKINYDLVRLDIYENPVRTYSVSDRLLDAEVNEISAMPFYSSSTMKFGKAEEASTALEEAAVASVDSDKPESEDGICTDGCKTEADGKETCGITKEQADESKEKGVWIKAVSAFAVLAFMAFGLWFALKVSGRYPQGTDTLGYLYRSDVLLQNIKKGILFPLYDRMWYNGVELMRYNAPVPLYLLSALEQIGGSVFGGYYLLIASAFFTGAVGWLIFGLKLKRVELAFGLGVLWFFMPENTRILMSDGDLPMVVVHALLPFLLLSVWNVAGEKSRSHGAGVSVLFALTGLCKFEITVMMLLALVVFFCFLGKKSQGKREVRTVIVSAIIGLLSIGIWLIPSLYGRVGLEAEDGSLAMAKFFEKMTVSLNPVFRWDGNLSVFYYGIAVLLIAVFGLFLGNKKTFPGFLTGILLFICTSESVYLLFVKLPFGRFLWMRQYVMISVAFVFLSILLWKGLKRSVVLILCGLLLLDCLPSFRYFYVAKADRGAELTVQKEERAERLLLGKAKDITTQRLAVFDLSTYGTFAPYYISGVGKKVPYTFGMDWEEAKTASNIVILNKAVESGRYAYVFDRSLELGNDTLLFDFNVLEKKGADAEKLVAVGKRFGYEPVDQNKTAMLFHRETEDDFGVVSYYENIAIGKAAKEIALLYPSFAEGGSNSISDYTLEDLAGYKRIFLSDFSYTDKEDAERLLTELADSGVKIYIDMNKFPENPKTNLPEFFGVEAQTVMLQDRFPTIEYQGKFYDTGEFPKGMESWKTNYMTGLSDITGTGKLNGRSLAFAGTNGHENIMFVGYNMAYYAEESDDPVGIQLLSELLQLSTEQLPERRTVPIEIVYEQDKITITSEFDNVNTTLAKLDIFGSTGFRTARNMVVVDKGITELTMKYPYFTEGLLVTLLGVLLGASYHICLGVHGKKRKDWGNKNDKA